MEHFIKISTLGITTICTGLAAGLCFTWANAVTPGIGKLNNYMYLQAFQQMNRAILNPSFFIVFFGAMLVMCINLYVNRNSGTQTFYLLLASCIIYFAGVIAVTILGNVPLNELLDKTNLENALPQELSDLRTQFEKPWNTYHYLRTTSAILAFVLQIVQLVLKIK